MSNITPLKEIIIIYYKDVDGEVDTLVTEKKNKKDLLNSIQTNKFVEVEGKTINCYLIQKIEEPNNGFDEHFYNLPKFDRRKLLIKDTYGVSRYDVLINSTKSQEEIIEKMYSMVYPEPEEEKTLEEKIAEARAGDDFYN